MWQKTELFERGDGTDQFVNQALIANSSFLLGMPYSFFTAGVVSPRDWGGMAVFVMDPRNRTADFMQFGDLFQQGIIIGGEIKFKTKFFGLPGQRHIGDNIQATPWLNITPDVQWIRPWLGAISTDNAFVYGVRANATF